MSHEKDKIIGRLVSRRLNEEGEKGKEKEGGSRTTPPLSSTRGRPRSRIIALIYSRSGAEIPGSFGLITLLNDRAPPASSAGLRLSIEFLRGGGGRQRTEHRFPFFRSLLSSPSLGSLGLRPFFATVKLQFVRVATAEMQRPARETKAREWRVLKKLLPPTRRRYSTAIDRDEWQREKFVKPFPCKLSIVLAIKTPSSVEGSALAFDSERVRVPAKLLL